MKKVRIGLVLLLFSAWAGAAASGSHWTAFKSGKYLFSTCYPASWHLLSNSVSRKPAFADTLDIINFPNSERVEGVVLKNGGAEISVGPAPPHVRTVEQWIAEGTRFSTRVVRREVRGPGRRPSGCARLTEVTSLSHVGPGRNFAVTQYYCTTARGLYGVQLINWQGDPHQARLQATALKMALSLRTW